MAINDNVDSLKPLSDICMSDSLSGPAIGVIHHELRSIVLHGGVPTDVRQIFETAKNLSLYSWFVQRFQQVAELTALSALEMALRIRFKHENPGASVPSFKNMLEIAKANKWMVNERFPNRFESAYRNAWHRKSIELALSGVLEGGQSMPVEEPTEEEVLRALESLDEVGAIAGFASKLRNELAHGSTMLLPGSISTLRLTAEAINQIYLVHSNGLQHQ